MYKDHLKTYPSRYSHHINISTLICTLITLNYRMLHNIAANVLYKKNGQERYPNFKLYKMIARTVHNHTPKEQLEFPFFEQFLIIDKTIVENEQIMDFDTLPCYA